MAASAERLKGGFTIIEVVLALALIAALASFVISGAAGWGAFAGQNKTPERALKIAVLSASSLARGRCAETELKYDARGFFQISDIETSAVLKRIFLKKRDEEKFAAAQKQNAEFEPESAPEDEIVFLPAKPEIIGRERLEFPPLGAQRAVFSPDGSSSAFSVSISSKSRPEPLVIEFDSMSSKAYESRVE